MFQWSYVNDVNIDIEARRCQLLCCPLAWLFLECEVYNRQQNIYCGPNSNDETYLFYQNCEDFRYSINKHFLNLATSLTEKNPLGRDKK